ncbi:MAG: hypothetical protein WBE38_14560 [Terracidiphilus sp.]|jgi:hypothetical protein
MTPLRTPGFRSLVLLACAAAFALPLRAQTAPAPAAPPTSTTITIRMYDARSGRQLTPSNFLVRFNHQDEIHNESLRIDDDSGDGQLTVPAGSSFFSVEGTFNRSMDVYFNCDAAKESDDRRRHWYSISDILTTGVIAPNECFNGKYERPRLAVKPGEFIFYVRERNWRDAGSY